MKIEGYDSVYVVGDIHGEFRKLVFDITYKYKLKNSVIIIAGDCGFGFNKPNYYEIMYRKISKRLDTMNNIILCIRGNHDDPDYFNLVDPFGWSRMKLVSDYTVLEVCGKTILCIGGATSIDKSDRIDFNSKMEKYRSSKRSWWKEERSIKVGLKHLPSKVDIVISHETPIQFEPIITRFRNMSFETYSHICEDREYLGQVFLELHPKYWYYGHYHQTYSGSFGDTLYRGLDIEEFLSIPVQDT